ncbi:Unannotated [Lentimonas sp. CC19]|nr:Unannotated [Lentimonas sp. CC10]CAA6696167.1 Unannotated [Lentimonas sp. CC19]CAA7070914.1 Unannotated [Lentimonas sp. CC11]
MRTLLAMTTITATKARNTLYSLIDEANESHVPIQITGKRGNAVLIAEDDWRAISETMHLSMVPGMVESIVEGMNEKIEDCSESLEW